MSLQLFDMNTQEGRDACAAYEKERDALTSKGQQLYAKIKRNSKYYGQTKPHEVFRVYIVAEQGYGDYVVQGGPGGQYRLSDVNLFVIQDGFQQRIA